MLSTWATVILTWAAVQAYGGLYFLSLWAYRRPALELRAFGVTCLGMAAHSFGAALLPGAAGLHQASWALSIEYVGLAVAAAGWVEFMVRVAPEPPRSVPYVAWTAAILVAVFVLLGGLFDPEVPAAGRPEPRIHTLGAVVLSTLGLAFVVQVAALRRLLPPTPQLTVLTAVGTAIIAAGVYDQSLRVADLAGTPLLEHVAVAALLVGSLLLLRRFAQQAEALTAETEELGRSHDALRVAREQQQRQQHLAAFGELSAVIAHEVRNPLAVIKNAISSLGRPALRSADRDTLLAILDEEVDRLRRLVRDLLAYARPVEPRGEPVNLERLVPDVVGAARVRLGVPDEVEVTIDMGCHPVVNGDVIHLRRAIGHIVDNAFQAIGAAGHLVVRCRDGGAADRSIEVVFQDDGPGMDDEVRGKATEPFFTTRPSGTGLGLAIVARVLRDHGGRVELTASPAGGTEVRLHLPRSPLGVA